MVCAGLIRRRIPIVVDELMLAGVPKITVFQTVAEDDGVGGPVRHTGSDGLGRVGVENHHVGSVAAGRVQGAEIVRAGGIDMGGVGPVGWTEVAFDDVGANRDAIVLPAG